MQHTNQLNRQDQNKNIPDIIISKINETYIKVLCADDGIKRDIQERFSFEIPNKKFNPLVKAKRWDGVIRLYNTTHNRMYAGLLLKLLKFCKKRNYNIQLDSSVKDLIPNETISMELIQECVERWSPKNENGDELTPYEYQYDALHYMLNMNRSIGLLATSAGKSLVIALLLRFYMEVEELTDRSMIVVVPSIMLVNQLYDDLATYFPDMDVSLLAQKITGKYEKRIYRPIVISTWQSLKNIEDLDPSVIICDEAHTVEAKVLSSILERIPNCKIRHGLTGTLKDNEESVLSVEGLLGPSKRIVTSKELIEEGRATKVKVKIVMLNYSLPTKTMYHDKMKELSKLKLDAQRMGAKRYHTEIDFINELESRKNFIQNMLQGLKGNSIALFDRVEGYGIPLYEDMKQKHDNTYLISGDVNGDERDHIKHLLEDINDGIVYATSNIMSTGVSIKNLHNMVFLGSSKSKIRVLQSIGRLMRLHESKKEAYLYDIVDMLDLDNKENITMKHIESRLSHYITAGFEVEYIKLDLT